MSYITLDQFEQILKTNILTDPSMWVRNNSFPRGQISFRVLGSDFRMRDVIIPVSGAAVDLTEYAPLANLLASAELKQVFNSRQLKLINPQDMPEPNDQKFPEYTNVTLPVTAGDTHIAGLAPVGTQVQAVIGSNILAVFAEAGNVFSIPVTGLTAGALVEVSFIKDKFETKKVSFTVQAPALQPFPQPTVDAYTMYDAKISGTTIAGAGVTLLNDGNVMDAAVAGVDGKFELTVTQPTGVLTIKFVHEDYIDATVTVTPANRVANIGVQTPDYLDEHLVLTFTEAQPVSVHVEIEIAGQPLITDAIPDGTTEFEVLCGSIKGDVKVTVKSTGFTETSVTRTPNKNTFGPVGTVDVYEGETEISGAVSGTLTANDVKAELVTLDGTYNADVVNGQFSFTVPALNAGDASVTITSAFFNSSTHDFEVLPLQVQVNPTASTVYVGETDINGTGEVDADIYIDGNKVGTVMQDGTYSLSGPAMVSAETLTFRKQHYADKTLVVTPTPLSTFTKPTVTIVADDTQVTGNTEAGATIVCAKASSVNVDGAGAFTIQLTAPAVEAETISLQISKRGFTTATFDYVVAAKPAE